VCPICHTSTSTRTPFPAKVTIQDSAGPARADAGHADRLGVVRYLALLVIAIVFLTGLVWWAFFIGNTVVRLIRRR
jgi:hypothetical protein